MANLRRIIAAITGSVFLAGTLPAPVLAQRTPVAADERFAVDHFKERRLALVIGNSKYSTQPLDNPGNDALLVAQTLRELNFEVLAFHDLVAKDLRRVTREFAQRLSREDGVGVFYYAGHGVEINGRNYLLPVDIDVADEEQIKDDSMDLAESLMDRLEKSKKRVNLIILDACRDNPFRRAKKRGLGGGLAEMNAPRGTLIAYATEPGRRAEDGTGGANSVYTLNLAKHMKREGLEVERALSDVAIDVSRLTRRTQIPWKSGQLLSDFYFKPLDPRVERARREADDSARIKEEIDKIEERQQIRLEQEKAQRRRLEESIQALADREEKLRLELAKERQAREKAEREMQQQYQLAQANDQQKQRAQQQAERDRLAREAAERERLAREASEREKLARETADREKSAREAEERERVAALKREAEASARAQAEQQRLAREKVIADKLAREKAEQERLAAEAAERTRKASETKERLALARLQEEQERAVRVAAERERLALATAEQERVARERVEAERLAAQKAEQERLARDRREKEAIAKAIAEREQLAKAAAERDRQLKAQAAAEREQLAKVAAEAERTAQAQSEELRIAQQRAEADRAAKAQAAAQQQLADLARERDKMLSESWKREQLALLDANRTGPSYRPVEQVAAGADGTFFVRGVKLPTDVAIRRPGPEVPANCAAFGGAWGNGRWGNRRTGEIWVEEVAPDCSATVVFANGGISVTNQPAGFRRLTGQIRDRTLYLQWTSSIDQRPSKAELTLDGKKLSGNWDNAESKAKAVFHPISTEPRLQTGIFANEDLIEDSGTVVTRISKINFDQPLPRGLPGIPVLTTRELQSLIEKEPRVVLLDAFRDTQHMTLPNSVWIPGMGEAFLGAGELWRIDQALKVVTDHDYERPIVIFHRSVKFGWDGYHAMLRVLGAGYHNLYWYRGGADAWFDAGLPVVQSSPYPLALN